tara:strand:- start:575 stop:700 length:126 start_codon:yes stop_codon:yes gene_type:complete
MLQKIINFIANLIGLRRKKEEKEDKDKENKRNKPDDIYPLW